jgi:tetratricopeptide (TPR) repeat protein
MLAIAFLYLSPCLAGAWLNSPKKELIVLNAEMLLERGSRAFEDNDPEEAIELFQKSICADKRSAEAYYRLGVVYASIRDFKKAITYLKHAIRLKRDFAKAYVNLGSAYGSLKIYKQALAAFRKALALEPDDPVIYYNIGSIYTAMKKQDLALKYFDKAKKLGLDSAGQKKRE